jgi:hypothetical protein
VDLEHPAAGAFTGMLVRRSSGVDELAIAVFEESQRSGEPVTMRLVKRVINEAATTVSPLSVYRTTVGWECAISATQRPARR